MTTAGARLQAEIDRPTAHARRAIRHPLSARTKTRTVRYENTTTGSYTELSQDLFSAD